MKAQSLPQPAEPFAEQLRKELLRCQLSRTHLLVIVTADARTVKFTPDFIRATRIEAARSFLRLFWNISNGGEDQAMDTFLLRDDWERPDENELLLAVLDATAKRWPTQLSSFRFAMTQIWHARIR